MGTEIHYDALDDRRHTGLSSKDLEENGHLRRKQQLCDAQILSQSETSNNWYTPLRRNDPSGTDEGVE